MKLKRTLLSLLIVFLFCFAGVADTQNASTAIGIGGYPELLELNIPFTGSWKPGIEEPLIELGDFSDIKNMRYSDTGIEGVSGFSKINSSVVNATYLKIKNGFHFTKDQPSESHVLVQAYNSGLTASKVYENETAIPSTGNFVAAELHTDASGASKGRFATAPQGTMVYCNEADRPQVWPGDEGKCMAFITSTATIGNSITNPRNYTDRIQNTLQTSDEVATVGGGAAYSLLLHCDGSDEGTTFTNSATSGTITAATIAFVDSDPDTITDSGNGFVTAGFVVGSITVSGSSSNDGTYVVDTVAAGTLTLDAGESLTGEAAGATVTITMHPVNVNGDAQTDTDQYKFPSASCLLDGTGDYLSIPDSAHWYMGSGKFTIDKWVRWASVPGTPGSPSPIWSQYVDSNNYVALYWDAINSGSLIFKIRDSSSTTVELTYAGWTPSLNTQYHIEVVRGWGGNANSWALCVNGTAQATVTDSDSWPDLAAAFCIGTYSANYLDGHVDELRVWKGTTAHEANFTPPSREYGSSSGYFLIGSSWALDGVKLYIASPNISTSTLAVEEWTGTAWSSLTVTDNTSSGGVSLAATGTVTWATTETTSKPKLLHGKAWYWYQFALSAGSADIYYVTVDAPFQDITNIWDGAYSTCAGAKVYEATNSDYWDYSDEVNSELTTDVMLLDNLEATNDYILLGFDQRQQGIAVSFVATEENSTASTTLAVYYWDGSSWVAVSGLHDGTSVGSISFARNGVITWAPPSQTEEFPYDFGEGDLFYYYKLVFDENIDASCDVYYIEGIPAPDDILPYALPLHFQNRTLLLNRNGSPSEVLVSAENTSYIFNGSDSASFNIGTDTALTAAASLSNSYDASIDAVAVACKDSETWTLRESGTGGPNFIQHQLSKTIGCPAPLTMDACEIIPGFNVVVWLSYDGPVMCDGATITPIRGIEPYFDPIDSSFVGYSNLEAASGFIDPVLKEYNLIIGDNWLIYDIKRSKWFKKEPSTYPECGWRVRDTNGGQYCYLGYDTGYMYRNENTDAFDGSDITQSVTLADIAPSGLWFESQLDFLKLVVVAKNTGTNETITVKHRADGATSWTALRGVPMYETGSRYVQHTQRVNEAGITHQLYLEAATNDQAKGMEPLWLSLRYKPLRTDTSID